MQDSKSERFKKITLKNTLLSYIGYLIPVSASYLAIYLNLTSCSYRNLNWLVLVIVLTVSVFYMLIYLKQEVTYKYGQIIGVLQLINWLLLSGVWLILMNDIKVLALASAVIPFTFLFLVGNLFSSFAILGIFVLSYNVITYYCINAIGFSGNMKIEILYSIVFIYSSVVIIIMAQGYKKRRKEIKSAKKETDEAKDFFEKNNKELSKSYKRIRKLADRVKELSNNVSEESSVINDSSNNLYDGALNQDQSIKNVLMLMNKINEKTNNNNNSVMDVNELVVNATEIINKGLNQVNEMNFAMGEISDLAKNIDDIITSIDNIAFQTRLLALNSSIQSVKAGKYGKGFSIVAQEVRSLASRSAEAADMTKELIQETIEDVNYGTTISENTVQLLMKIKEEMDIVIKYSQGIYSASTEQKDEVAQVNHSMVKISQITTDNSSTAQQTRKSAEKLNNASKIMLKILQPYELTD